MPTFVRNYRPRNPKPPIPERRLAAPKSRDGLEDDDPITPFPNKCKKKLRDLNVGVVGGGLAGVMAALRLSQQGVNVKLYEAHPQVGGRVRSNGELVKGRVTEVGAELIGGFHTVWLKLARKYGLSMINLMGELEYERERLSLRLRLDNTEDLSWSEVKRLEYETYWVLWEIAEQAAKLLGNETCPWNEKDQALMKKLDNTTVKQAIDDIMISLPGKMRANPERGDKNFKFYNKDRLIKYLELLLVNDEVDQLDAMNYLGLLCKVRGGQNRSEFQIDDPKIMGYWEELEIFRCANGSQQLAKKMADEIIIKNRKNQIISEKAVTKITINQNNVQLFTRTVVKGKPRGTESRDQTSYDYVILAIPPSVWSGVDIFEIQGNDAGKTKLDLEKEIGKMRMSPAVKFFSIMKKRFWINYPVKIKHPNGTEEILGSAPSGGTLNLGQIWEGTDNQTIAVDRPQDNQGIVLSVFAGPTKRPNPKDPKSARVPRSDEMITELRSLFPKKDGYDDNLSPPRHLYQDWPKEPYIKTGYWSPDLGEILKVCPKLIKPFHTRLYFAGEHTYLSHFGYMEGALRSGIRAANSIMSAYCGLINYSPCPEPRPKLGEEQLVA